MPPTPARFRMDARLAGDVWKHLRNRDERLQRLKAQAVQPIRITSQDDGSTTRIDLMDEIGFWGITAQDFVDELLAITSPSIELHINSPGGDVFDGVAIMNALADHPATVNVVVDGIAASAASYIALGGDTVKMNRASQMMIHDALGMCIGNAADMELMKGLLDRISDTIASIYADKAGGTADEWRDLMRAETWYSATEALEAGLADEAVSGPKNAPADDDESEEGSESEDDGDDDESEEKTPPPPDEEDEGDDDDEEPEAFADRFRTQLAAFKYAGRAQAPAPKTTAKKAVDVSKLQAALKGAFG